MKYRRRYTRKTQKCFQCDKKFMSNFCCSLHAHVHQMCERTWFPCHKCEKRFSQVSKLITHRALHVVPKSGITSRGKFILKQRKCDINKGKNDQFADKLTQCKRPNLSDCNGNELKEESIVDQMNEKGSLVSNGLPGTFDDDLVLDNVFAKFGLASVVDHHANTETDKISNELQVHVVSSSNEIAAAKPVLSNCHNERATEVGIDDSIKKYLQTVGLYYCNICGRSFTRKVTKDKHWEFCHMKKMTDVLKESSLDINDYKQSSFSKKKKNGSSRRKNDKKSNKCPKCGLDLKFPSWVSRHMLICNEKNEQKRSFLKTQGQANNKHHNLYRSAIQVHEGYGRRYILEDLMDTSGPVKGHYSCKFCCKVFVFKSSLKRHLRLHTGETPYKCLICKQRFALRKKCLAHVKKHKLNELENIIKDSPIKSSTGSEIEKEECSKPEFQRTDTGRGYSQGNSSPENLTGIHTGNILSVSEMETTLSNEFMTNRSCKQQNCNYFDEVDFSDELDSEILSRCELKNKLVKKSLRGKKSGESESSTDDSPVERQSELVANARNKTNIFMLEEPQIRKREKVPEDLVNNRMNSNIKEIDEVIGEADSDNVNEASESEGYCSSSFFDKETSSEDDSIHRKQYQDDVRKENESKNSRMVGGEKDRAADHQTSNDEDCNTEYESVTNENMIKRNVNDYPNDLPYQCETCNIRFPNKFVLKRHEAKNGHCKKSFKCTFCDRIYSHESAFENHMYIHKHKDGMVCQLCNKQLLSLTTFQAHQKLHKNNPFSCYFCSELFSSQLKLDKHIASAHDEEKEFKCKYCSKTFDWRGNYIRHLNKHTNVKKFVCGICKCSFNISSNLGRHIRQAHRGEVPEHMIMKQWHITKGNDYVKSGKSEAFYKNQFPNRDPRSKNRHHMVADSAESNRNASWGCVNKTQDAGIVSLKKKKHKCDQCDKLCLSREGLSFHQRYAHQQDNDAKTGTALIHYVITNETFICQVCQSTLSSRGSMMNHMRQVHSLSPDDKDILGVPSVEGQRPPRFQSNNTSFDMRNSAEGRCSDHSNSSLEQEDIADVCSKKDESDLKIQASKRIATSTNRASRLHNKGSNSSCINDANFAVKCTLCGRKFNDRDKLQLHLQNFHKIPASLKDTLIGFSSSLSKSTNNDQKYKNTKAADMSNNKTVHVLTGADESTRRSGRKRKMPINPSATLQCPICEKEFDDFEVLQGHAAICDAFEDGNTEASYLELKDAEDTEFDYEGSCDIHINNTNNLEGLSQKVADYHCNVCNITFYHPRALNRHKVFSPAHPKLGNIKCPTCKEIVNAKNFKDHFCNGKRIQCHICDVCFSSMHCLSRHMKTIHSDVKSFPCENCGKFFNRKSNLKVHLSKCM